MGRFGRFVDGSAIRARMDRKDARVNRSLQLTQDQRIAAARQAYGNVQLRREYAHEYHEGRIAYEQGHRFDSCRYEAYNAEEGLKRSAWQLGWRDAHRDEGS